MQLTRLIKMSIQSIWANKVRSFLTMLGIIIGIASVIVLVGIGQGTKESVSSQIESLGTNLIAINIVGNRNKAISMQELNDLKKKPGIKDIAPVLTNSVNVKVGDNTASTSMEASTANYAQIRNLSVSSGRFINSRDVNNRYKVAVVGVDVANELFNSTDVVGQTMNVNGVEFTIVGILNSTGSSIAGSNDDKIIVPLSTAERLTQTTQIKTFYAEAESQGTVDEAMGYLQLFLNNKYRSVEEGSNNSNSNNNYRILSQSSILETATQTTSSMTTMLTGTAAISLLVGGIGIMNIMLVSVIERTREIGIRKAVGAKRRTILIQFLIEAASLSAVGGIIGVVIGYGGAKLLAVLLRANVAISGNVVLGSFLFSVLVGIVFGIYPANKASKLSPMEALRFE
ncbi:putative ABC transport system permease protein [Clostridium acetobutylicum]|uniref:Predicted permease n=1 Tax=Clostridium acetobutylicum (strain ATCC 824 / DSM 792 / JCM 1419 / IAM 19013 / LMG 5710 / NBRC 13948 / NRRL B-527 / VKM B-1787 / 2291 / W) TaxID=272562 RepID=Q97M78_CLOAB|nr:MULTISPECIES: ABC transporter permease [Clostridium]AAK78301.1 Predicted permease [Clostridium acetobutylicum ATCC 824]ADZ19370.1 permease [Clostridium acetobutylicum EA 2018]AEI33798.1 permease [Clostridium acetobutylicum DSM 1731]AWV80027.1 permease [Clostridium acetobutylicum]MBC2395845.1 FtsX-like permease family protein [Clostridium acetobutylicum]